jgi:hypothetical protein
VCEALRLGQLFDAEVERQLWHSVVTKKEKMTVPEGAGVGGEGGGGGGACRLADSVAYSTSVDCVISMTPLPGDTRGELRENRG